MTLVMYHAKRDKIWLLHRTYLWQSERVCTQWTLPAMLDNGWEVVGEL